MVRKLAVVVTGVLVTSLAPLAAGGPSVGADPQPPSADWQLVFEDQFTGTELDRTKWSIGHENQPWHGGFNTADALTFDGNAMTIDTWTDTNGRHNTAVVQGGSNEGGPNLTLATYGFVEARIKFEDEEGMRSSWWLYTPDISSHDSEPLGDPAAAGTEIDMIEHFFSNSDPTRKDRFASTLHWDGYQGGHQTVQTAEYNWASTGRPSLQGNYHDYSVEWTPTEYIFRIDDIETGRLNRAISHRSLFPILSTELVDMPAGVHYGAKGAARSRVTVDYVKIWQKPIANGLGAVPATWTVSTAPDTPTVIPLTVRHVEGRTTTVLVSSSNPTLLPASAMQVTGAGADRSLLVYPAAGQTGSTTLTVTVATNGSPSLPNSQKQITLNVTGISAAAPSWNAIPNRESTWGGSTAQAFTLPSAGTVQVASNNDDLVPDASVALVGSGTRYALALTPRPGRTGVAEIAVTYGGQTDTFAYTIHAGTMINGDVEHPSLGWTYNSGASRFAPAGQNASIVATTGTAVQTVLFLEPNTSYVVGATGLMVSGGSSPLTVSGYGGSPASASVTFTGATATRKWVTFTTGATATSATITLGDSDADSLAVDDVYVARAPMMTAISDRTTSVGAATSAEFTVGRVGDPLPAGAVTATSDNSAVVAPSGLQVVAGSDANDPFQRKVTIAPVAGVSGVANITVTATDPRGHQVARTFKVTVNAGNFANGGFDYGQGTTGWELGGQAWTFADNTNQLLRLGPGGYAQYRVTGLTAGQTYELAGRMQSFQSNSQVWMGVRDHGGSPLAAFAPYGGWVENGAAAVRFVPTGTSATVYVANTATASSANLGQVDALTLLPVSGGQAAPFARPGRPMAAIGERSTAEGTVAVIPFQSSVTPVVTSSDTTLFPAGSLVLAGSGSDQVLRATPAAGRTGTANITLTVGATSATFPLTVGAGTFRDGGFSEPTATSSWNNTTTGLVPIADRLVGGGLQHTGDRGARLRSGQMKMNLTVIRGTAYRLDDFVRYESAGSGSGTWIRVLDGSTVLASTTLAPSATGWTAKPLTFTAPGSGTATVTVEFTNWEANAALHIDDVAVVRQ